MSDLAERINRRRQQAGLTSGVHNAGEDNEASALSVNERLAQIKETIRRNDYDPIHLAEQLSLLIRHDKMVQMDLAKKIGVSQGWISKLLSLHDAPAEVRDKIRKRELSIIKYYALTVERAKKLAITRKQAVELAVFLRDIAVKQGLFIELSRRPTKTELLAVLSLVKEIRAVVLKS